MVKNPPANTGDTRDPCSIPGSGRSPGKEKKTCQMGLDILNFHGDSGQGGRYLEGDN